jgi:hypothetical protein
METVSQFNRSPFDTLRANGESKDSGRWFGGLTMTGHPFDTVRPEALEGTNGAQDGPDSSKDRDELVEP